MAMKLPAIFLAFLLIPAGVGGAALIGKEDRERLATFLAREASPEQAKLFSASGVINCGLDKSGLEKFPKDIRSNTSAQVTAANDVITFAAHTVLDDQCQLRTQMEKCYFYRPGKPKQKYQIDAATLITGSTDETLLRESEKDSGLKNPCYEKNSYFDWAVVKLKKPVPDVVPYAVPDSDPEFQKGMPLLLVTSGDSNFEQNRSNNSLFRRCSVRSIWRFENIPLGTDCDTGFGASGGALLLGPWSEWKNKSHLTMIAINVAESTKAVDGAEFNEDTQYNVGTPVETFFLAAIKRLAGK